MHREACSRAVPGTVSDPMMGTGTRQQWQGMGGGLCAPGVHSRGSCKGKEQPKVFVWELWGCYVWKCRGVEMGFSPVYFTALPSPTSSG